MRHILTTVIFGLIALICITLAACSSDQSTATAYPKNPADPSLIEGKQLFTKWCQSCHPNGQAGLGPQIGGMPAKTVDEVILKGKGLMPKFDPTVIPADKRAEIAQYTQHINEYK